MGFRRGRGELLSTAVGRLWDWPVLGAPTTSRESLCAAACIRAGGLLVSGGFFGRLSVCLSV